MSTSAPFLVVMIFSDAICLEQYFVSFTFCQIFGVRWSSLTELILSAIPRCASVWVGADDQSEDWPQKRSGQFEMIRLFLTMAFHFSFHISNIIAWNVKQHNLILSIVVDPADI